MDKKKEILMQILNEFEEKYDENKLSYVLNNHKIVSNLIVGSNYLLYYNGQKNDKKYYVFYKDYYRSTRFILHHNKVRVIDCIYKDNIKKLETDYTFINKKEALNAFNNTSENDDIYNFQNKTFSRRR